MNRWYARSCTLLGLCFALMLMGNDGCSEDPEGEAPAADAGADITVELGEPATLDGSASADPQGSSLTYFWNLESKPIFSQIDSDAFDANESGGAASTAFTPDQPGTYGVSLYVENAEGFTSDLDYVVIIAGSTNTLPLADAGADVTVAIGQVASLDGSASADPEGASLEYEWSFDLLPADSILTEEEDLYNQGSPEAAIVPDAVGQYVLRLRVYDGEFWSAPDFVTVSAVDDNEPPIANAGESWELTPCSPDEIVFDGRASYDPDGASITYQWELVSVPAGSAVTSDDVEGMETGTPSLVWDVVGLYTMRLVVQDDEIASEADYVAVRTVPHEPNDAPTADAGGNITIEASAYCSGGTCSPCTGREELMDGSGSIDPDNDDLEYTWVILSGDAEINGDHAEQAEIVLPSQTTSSGSTTYNSIEVELTVEDCQGELGRDTDYITVTFACTGTPY